MSRALALLDGQTGKGGCGVSTPTISEAARLELVRALKEAQQIADERQSPVVEIGGFWVSEALSALDSAHPAPKEGETPETDAMIWKLEPDTDFRECYKQMASFARSLELRLSEAKRKRDDLRKDLNRIAEGCGVGCPDREEAIKRIIAFRSQLKTANELLARAQAHMDKHHQRAALCDDIDTHLNQQSK